MAASNIAAGPVHVPAGSIDGFPVLQRLLIFGAATITITLFALTPATTRIAVGQVDGVTLGILRTIGAGLFALPLLLIFRLPPPKKLADWGLLLLSALGSFAGFPIMFSLGQQITSAAHACLIMAVMPLFVGILGMAIDRRLPRIGWFLGAALAVIGEAALVGIKDQTSTVGSSLAGDAIVLSGCLLFAGGVVAGARLSTRINPWAATLWAITVATVALSPLAFIRGGTLAWSTFASNTWIALAHVSFGATLLANVAWLWALSRGGIVRIAPLQFSQPVLALIFAYVILGEHLSPLLVLIGVLIMTGILVAYRGACNAAPIRLFSNTRPWLWLPRPTHVQAAFAR